MTAGWLLVRGKVRLPKVEHHMFAGYVMPNEENIKSVQLKCRYCLGVSLFTISFLITCILVEKIDIKIGHFHNSQTSMILTWHKLSTGWEHCTTCTWHGRCSTSDSLSVCCHHQVGICLSAWCGYDTTNDNDSMHSQHRHYVLLSLRPLGDVCHALDNKLLARLLFYTAHDISWYILTLAACHYIYSVFIVYLTSRAYYVILSTVSTAFWQWFNNMNERRVNYQSTMLQSPPGNCWHFVAESITVQTDT